VYPNELVDGVEMMHILGQRADPPLCVAELRQSSSDHGRAPFDVLDRVCSIFPHLSRSPSPQRIAGGGLVVLCQNHRLRHILVNVATSWLDFRCMKWGSDKLVRNRLGVQAAMACRQPRGYTESSVTFAPPSISSASYLACGKRFFSGLGGVFIGNPNAS
jgi:hypothetical protein